MSIFDLWEKHFGLYRGDREEMPAYVPKDFTSYLYWGGSGQSHLKQRDFLRVADPGWKCSFLCCPILRLFYSCFHISLKVCRCRGMQPASAYMRKTITHYLRSIFDVHF